MENLEEKRWPLQPIFVEGNWEWLEEVFPGTKWKPYNAPLFSKEELEKGGIVDLTKNSDKYKFEFATPKINLVNSE